VRYQLGHVVKKELMSAVTLSRHDYCSAILVGRPASTEFASAMMLNVKPHDCPTPALRKFPITVTVDYKLCHWFMRWHKSLAY